MTDVPHFARELLRQPRTALTQARASAALARAMTVTLHPGSGGVLELGAGAGRVTATILARGVRPENLTLVEHDPARAHQLRIAWPGLRVVPCKAQEAGALGLSRLDAVISCLPLAAMASADQRAILKIAFDALGPGGAFVQVSYGRTQPVLPDLLASLRLTAERGPLVWGNLPPARVHIYRAAESGRGSMF